MIRVSDEPVPPALSGLVERGEKLVWWDRPRQGLMLRRVDALLIPFSILWGGFVIFWEIGVLTMPSSGLFGLFGVPFILAGVYFMIGRFFHDAWRRRGVLYGLTTERVLIISRSDLKSINLASCGELRLARHRDGRGSISIGPEC